MSSSELSSSPELVAMNIKMNQMLSLSSRRLPCRKRKWVVNTGENEVLCKVCIVPLWERGRCSQLFMVERRAAVRKSLREEVPVF